MVMELVPGVDAHTLLRERRQLTPGQTVQIVAQVCEALAYTHDHGVIHHDVSRSSRTSALHPTLPQRASQASWERPATSHRATEPQATAIARMPPLGKARPDLSRGLIETVERALAHDPAARQDSVAQFRAQVIAGQSWSPSLHRGHVVPPDAVPSALPKAA